MPHDVVRAAGHDRSRSLGHLGNAWIEHFVRHGPGDISTQPVVHGQEYYDFVVDCYALDANGRQLYDSAFLSRPKGCDKSGMAARISLFEAMGPCRFDGFAVGGEVFEDPWGLGFRYEYQPGEPMGRAVHNAFVRIMATEEMQTGQVYDAIYLNLTDETCPLSMVPGVEAGLKATSLPNGSKIIPSTASAASKDGGKETFIAFDETHLYDTPVLIAMYATVTRNLRKRKATAGTWYLETTTMFAKGANSVAEQTYTLAGQILEGLTRSDRLLFDHRYGECEDLSSEDMLRAAILEAFGEAIEWNDVESILDEFYDPRKETTDSRRYFLNAPTDSFDAWMADYEWNSRFELKLVGDGEMITLGFDGSRSRKKGVTDATALIGCRVSDGHVFQIGVWEQPSGPAGENWQIPVAEVEAAVDNAFDRWNVVAFYADPAKWESYVAKWEATYGKRLKAKVTVPHPIEFWMVGGHVLRTVRALDGFHSAVLDDELTHDGAYELRRHVLNARRRPSRSGMQIAKESPDSPRKIDAAIAAVLAYQARTDAIAQGVLKVEDDWFVPVRVR